MRDFEGRLCLSNQGFYFRLNDDDLVTGLKTTPSSPLATNLYLGPGLCDLQVNGCHGVDFNCPGLTTEMIEAAVLYLRQHGTTLFLPTIITGNPRQMCQNLRVIARAIEENPVVAAAIPGIHLEGPFISPEPGPRGAHPVQFVRPPDYNLFSDFWLAAGYKIWLITLAPEWPQAPNFIRHCCSLGLKVAIGHTNANTEQIDAAVQAGASLSTHLGNGVLGVLPRHPNCLWDQLAKDLWASLIADGHHLPPSFLKVALKTKGHRAMLVSDATDLTGCEPGEYARAIGGRVLLTPDSRLCVAATPQYLAGSACLLPHCVEFLVKSGLTDVATAWAMASVRPREFLGLPPDRSSYVMFRCQKNGRLAILMTINNGRVIYRSDEV